MPPVAWHPAVVGRSIVRPCQPPGALRPVFARDAARSLPGSPLASRPRVIRLRREHGLSAAQRV